MGSPPPSLQDAVGNSLIYPNTSSETLAEGLERQCATTCSNSTICEEELDIATVVALQGLLRAYN